MTELNLTGFKKGANAIGDAEASYNAKLNKEIDNLYDLVKSLVDVSIVNNMDLFDDKINETIINTFNEALEKSDSNDEFVIFTINHRIIESELICKEFYNKLNSILQGTPIENFKDYSNISIKDGNFEIGLSINPSKLKYFDENNDALQFEILDKISDFKYKNCEFRREGYIVYLKIIYSVYYIIGKKLAVNGTKLFASKGIKSKASVGLYNTTFTVMKAINE